MLIIIISYLIIISILCTLLLCQLVHKNFLSNKTLLFSNIGLLIISIITYIMTIVIDRTNLLFFIKQIPYNLCSDGSDEYGLYASDVFERFYIWKPAMLEDATIILSILSVIVTFSLFWIIFLCLKNKIIKCKKWMITMIFSVLYLIFTVVLVLLGRTFIEYPEPENNHTYECDWA